VFSQREVDWPLEKNAQVFGMERDRWLFFSPFAGRFLQSKEKNGGNQKNHVTRYNCVVLLTDE
jgi:hypothetical protein